MTLRTWKAIGLSLALTLVAVAGIQPVAAAPAAGYCCGTWFCCTWESYDECVVAGGGILYRDQSSCWRYCNGRACFV